MEAGFQEDATLEWTGQQFSIFFWKQVLRSHNHLLIDLWAMHLDIVRFYFPNNVGRRWCWTKSCDRWMFLKGFRDQHLMTRSEQNSVEAAEAVQLGALPRFCDLRRGYEDTWCSGSEAKCSSCYMEWHAI